MGLHLDEKLQKVRSLDSRMQALVQVSGSALENGAVCLSSETFTGLRRIDSFTFSV